MDQPRTRTVLDLDELEVEDGAGVLAIVDGLRARVAAGEHVVVQNCPQMVAHTLYKAGMLLRGDIELESYREEEPYG